MILRRKVPLRAPAVERDESEVRWLISYSDFMMQLVCLFILLYSVSSLDQAKAQEAVLYYRQYLGLDEPMKTTVPDLEGQRAGVDERSLVGGLKPGGADFPREAAYDLRPTDEGWTAEFPGPLFESGASALSPAAGEALDGLVRRLRAYVGTVRVIGEGDGPDALKVAQDRAESVVARLTRGEGLEPASVWAVGSPGEGRRVRIVFRRR